MGYDFQEEQKQELAYDLRQGLAKRLNEHLDEISRCRVAKDYQKWLELVDSVFIEVSKKLNDKEIEEYNKELMKVNKIINDNQDAYHNKETDGSKIYSVIKNLNVWVERKMEKYKMFGSKEEAERI